MKIIVLFGVTGDLARKKVIPSIASVQEQFSDTLFLPIFALGRKELPPQEMSILKNTTYISGDLESSKVYIKLKKEIQAIYKKFDDINVGNLSGVLQTKKEKIKNVKKVKNTPLHIVIYSSLPPQLHSDVAQQMQKNVISDLRKSHKDTFSFEFLIEKPVGTDLVSSQLEFEKFDTIFDTHSALQNSKKSMIDEEVVLPKKNKVIKNTKPKLEAQLGNSPMRFVDHYLAKEPLVLLKAMVNTNPLLFKDTVGSASLVRIEVMLFEEIGIDGRGAFYDKIGAIYDVAQNHLLQLLAEITQMRIAIIDCIDGCVTPKAIHKADIINALALDGTPIFGQYSGYANTEGVNPHSTTDTFFDVKAKPSPLFVKKVGRALAGLSFSVSGGKKMGMNKSGINLVFKGGKEIFIDMSSGSKNAYQYLFEKVISNIETHSCVKDGTKDGVRNGSENEPSLVGTLFATQDEIKAGWKFVMRAKRLQTIKELIVYANLHDILG